MFVDHYLLRMAKKVARLASKKFKITYKSLDFFRDDDKEKTKCAGICYYTTKRLHINVVKPGTLRYYRIEDIIDTVLHELAHLRYIRHDKKFWSLLKEMKTWFNAEYLQR